MKFIDSLRTYWCILSFTLGAISFSIAEDPFKCPEQFGYYPDLQDCSKYYVCVFGDSLHEKCTGGLFFSTELQTCDWPRNVECANGDKPGERPPAVVDFDEDDEVFSSSRRTASSSRPRPNSEIVSNFQSQDKDGARDRNRSQDNQRSRSISLTTKSDKQPTTPPPKKQSPVPTIPITKEPPTIHDDPLYLSDERSKVSDPLGNYDPQQPDFDEAAPPLIDSEGGIHIADGGHGLDAFAGLAHLPGLGDYSVIAKPIYNANSGTSDQLPAEDEDYKHRKPNPNSSRGQTSVSTKPRSLETFQSNNGRSKDPDVVIDYNNGNKNLQWNNYPQKSSATLPPITFDDSKGQRDYASFDVIPPLKTNIQDDHEKTREREKDLVPSREVQRGRNSNKSSYDGSSSKSDSEVTFDDHNSGNQEFSRLRNNYNSENQNRNADYGALSVYRAAKDEISRPNYQNEQSRLSPNINRPKNEDLKENVAKENIKYDDASYRKTSDGSRSDTNLNDHVPIPGESLDADFGVYTGNQRQNRKLDFDSAPSQDLEGSKGIIPAESIQPAVRQPNQIQPENDQKDISPKNEDRNFHGLDPNYEDQYDEGPRTYAEYDSSKPQYTDEYYTNQEDQETTTRVTTISRTRPTRPRKPLTTTTIIPTTTTPAPIRVRSRRPTNQASPTTKPNLPPPTTPATGPYRPQSLFSTPAPYTNAQKCDPRKCKLPDCRCGGTDVPNNLPPDDIPQIVLLTFDDAVNELNYDLYNELFHSGRANPNGCPILGTFYVSHEWTDYGQLQTLYSKGHEIASHSISHSYGEKFSKNQWVREIHGQREILHLYGGVKMEDIRGMRAPFLQIGGNKMFEMLYDANFTYDSSMPVYENNPPFWPYTLDYALNHECMVTPCPTKTYPGMWEIPMVMLIDLRGGRCSMGDACSNPPDEDGVFKMLLKNFNRHYKTNKAPFGLFYHSAWFNTQHHRRGFIKFLDEILKKDDVYFVTNWQLIQWMREPTPLSKIKSFEPFNCRKINRPAPCPTPTVCNVWYQGGVRYMKTCQQCPVKYPWVGNTGYESRNRG